MIRMDARVEFDVEALVAKYRDRAKTAQKILDESVIKDTDKYVRFRTGVLARSVTTASSIGMGKIVYDTPYAKKVYYDTASHVTKDIHPLATPRWFEESKKHNAEKWKEIVEKVLKGDK